MKITDRWLKNKGACSDAIKRLSKEKNRDEIYLINKGLKRDKFDWINWYISRRLNKTRRVRYAIYPAEQVLDIYEKKYADDKRLREVIQAARRYVKNPCEKNKVTAAAYATTAAAAYATTTTAAATYAAAATTYATYAAYTTAAAAYAAAAVYAAADAANTTSYTAAATYAAAATTYATYAAHTTAAADAAAATAAANAADKLKIKIVKYGIKLIKEMAKTGR